MMISADKTGASGRHNGKQNNLQQFNAAQYLINNNL